ncbi:hypothetical protein MKX01_027795 [Papaver californicum]|nr:hypothetical protein MKX01_027795 [Papaver californicum]
MEMKTIHRDFLNFSNGDIEALVSDEVLQSSIPWKCMCSVALQYVESCARRDYGGSAATLPKQSIFGY